MPGGVECNQNHEKQESITDDANKNASPSFVHPQVPPVEMGTEVTSP